MNNSNEKNQEQPASGIIVLKDGRVQVTFEKFSLDDVLELPRNVYGIIRDLLTNKDGMTPEGEDGVFKILMLLRELLPDNEKLGKAYLKMDSKKS